MELTPEIKAQLAEQKKNCIFCKIISKEIQSKFVFQDSCTSAILDIYPAVRGHTVYLLNEHYPIMPYIPYEEFIDYFGKIPKLCNAIMEGVASTGINVFIANGGVAGQQAGHFMSHILPRDNEDNFLNFLWKKGMALDQKSQNMLAHNFPIMMANHFKKNPANWHEGPGDVPYFLKEVYENSKILYEDEKVLCVLAKNNAVLGHIVVYSKAEEKFVQKLSKEDSAHLFFTASFAATVLFEGLGAQGTNIILKSGYTQDNPNGNLEIHVLARRQDDELKGILWKPKQPNYNLDDIASKIKDQTWKINYETKKKEINVVKPNLIKIEKKKENLSRSSEEEIEKAIKKISNN